MNVRKANINDASAICRICTDDLGYECSEEFVSNRLKNIDGSREAVFAAEIDGTAVGYIHAEIYTFISVSVFAVGAGVLSGIFSVNESKDVVTAASQIHGFGSAIGFTALVFFPLLNGIASIKNKDIIQGVICVSAFIIALIFFIFFIMGDKEEFKETIFSYAGLWERLSLFFMYVPFLYSAIKNLIAAA